MGACLVTDNSAQCEEWRKLYDGIVAMMGDLIERMGLEAVENLESYRWYEK
jgi:iron-sulfur cluster repair protein YtfE (RIC family)